MKYLKKKWFKSGLLAFVFLFNLLFLSDTSYAYSDNEQSLWEVKYLIQNNSIYNLSEEGINSQDISEVIKNLKDPYSEYYTKEEFNEFVRAINQNFYGIGIYNELVTEGIKINSFLKGSSAEEAGLKVGDIITSVDGKGIKGLTASEAVKYIKGGKGTFVNLSVKRGEQVLNFSVERREINIPTIEGELLDNKVAYIIISSFGEDTPSLLKEKLIDMNKKGAEKYIIDLRNNTGGYTNSAYDILGYFIEDNIATVMKDKDKNEYKYKAFKHDYVINKDIILLVNEYTASASEILSAALRDYNKALIVGIKTYGKGVQQTIFSLSNGDVLKLTTHSFYSPLGKEINNVGIMPNVNTNKIDPLKVAKLLFSGNKSIDNKKLLKLLQNNKEYYIDLEKGRSKEYWDALKYIVNTSTEGSLFLGKGINWTKLTEEDIKENFNVYFNDYTKMPKLVKSKEKAVFKIKLNKNVDINTVGANSIKLIQEETFEEVKINYDVENKDEIILYPVEAAKLQGDYFLIIEGLKGEEGGKLKNKVALPVHFE
ncbi:S41 family peptidase [Clostridium malenominatum]|uniref:S41 family peptidase n=1 Tax=Clostridium malenominatum TaxID=1539 RepID=A0ABN1IUB0_9CLOT